MAILLRIHAFCGYMHTYLQMHVHVNNKAWLHAYLSLCVGPAHASLKLRGKELYRILKTHCPSTLPLSCLLILFIM